MRSQRRPRAIPVAAMRRVLRTALMALAILALALAGPVEAHCAAPSPAAAGACPCTVLGPDAPDQGMPGQAGACATPQCAAAPPVLGHAAAGVAAPFSLVARSTAMPGRGFPGADPAPEQRPPIS